MIVGNVIGGGSSTPKTVLFQTEDGEEMYAVLVGTEQVFTATANDIREGKTAGTDVGVVTGTKVIPAYHGYTGVRIITSGSTVTIPNQDEIINNYDYTKLQGLICAYNSSLANSVSTEKVIIEDNVYNVQSTDSISNVTKNHDTKIIDLGITNASDAPIILRYFTYKEIE